MLQRTCDFNRRLRALVAEKTTPWAIAVRLPLPIQRLLPQATEGGAEGALRPAMATEGLVDALVVGGANARSTRPLCGFPPE